jgi:predicted O-methyltransferase YrrM
MVLGGEANLELLYHLVRGLGARCVIETGVAYGWSSLAILLAQEATGGGILISTDMPYPRLRNEGYVGWVVPERLRGSWTLIRRPDRPGLSRALARLRQIDLAHYDSDKTYAGQAWALRTIWRKLRPGGILIVDDIDCQAAFRDFSELAGVAPTVVDGCGKLIGVLQKPYGA